MPKLDLEVHHTCSKNKLAHVEYIFIFYIFFQSWQYPSEGRWPGDRAGRLWGGQETDHQSLQPRGDPHALQPWEGREPGPRLQVGPVGGLLCPPTRPQWWPPLGQALPQRHRAALLGMILCLCMILFNALLHAFGDYAQSLFPVPLSNVDSCYSTPNITTLHFLVWYYLMLSYTGLVVTPYPFSLSP